MTPEQRAREIRDALRSGRPVADSTFDELFAHEHRERSAVHWTPIGVAIRAAQLLATSPRMQILDVGSGVGKACLVGMMTTDAQWFGVEQDASLVAAAERAAHLFGLDARFVHGDAAAIDWERFDGFYFYNPFATLRLGDHVSPFVKYATVRRHVRDASARLAAARTGTRAVTYHGLGADLPPGYELVAAEPAGTDKLQLWVRGSS